MVKELENEKYITLSLQDLYDAAGEAKEFFFEHNPAVQRAVQNLDLFAPKATRLFDLLWFLAYSQGVFDTAGVPNYSFQVSDLDSSLFDIRDFSDDATNNNIVSVSIK
ncbi:MAG: hypothetical protein LBP59_11110 [Planctomycetaceae bacterium]|jgi:hypothetical protein|nr:hypothetical protein [Planctomycetaceae bacterium]